MVNGPTAPPEFVAGLRQYDPALRVRWAHRTRLWMIERKMPERHPTWLRERPSPYKSSRGLDVWDGWKDGYVHVLSVHPSLLDRRVFDVLAESDAWRQGSMKRLADHLDALDEQEEASQDRHERTVIEAANKEAHDRLAWLDGRRVAMSEPAPEPLAQINEIRHDGFVVRMRKVVG